jgi:hypothetical protein
MPLVGPTMPGLMTLHECEPSECKSFATVVPLRSRTEYVRPRTPPNLCSIEESRPAHA